VIVALLLVALCVVGCAQTRLNVIPLSNQYVAALSADDIVQLMRRAGFSNEQILELGTDLRNGLALSGAAQLKVGDKVEAIFAVHGDYVYITTRLRGSFIYDVKKGWVEAARKLTRSSLRLPYPNTGPMRLVL
jgi:hypothetical protein